MVLEKIFGCSVVIFVNIDDYDVVCVIWNGLFDWKFVVIVVCCIV